MKFENTQIMNFNNAIRGLRNPMNSWQRSDSWGGIITIEQDDHLEEVAKHWMYKESEEYNEVLLEKYLAWLCNQGILQHNGDAIEAFYFGPKDLNLAQRMIKAGTSDRKFLRQILVSVDITGPLYWWKEFDTYKIGTVANSTSTMHTLTKEEITLDMFSFDNLDLIISKGHSINGEWELTFKDCIEDILISCNNLRNKFLETKDKRYWRAIIQLLPNAWNQTRTVTMNYEVLTNIYSQRKNHRLTEWHAFCDWVKTLPYSFELITFNIDKE